MPRVHRTQPPKEPSPFARRLREAREAMGYSLDRAAVYAQDRLESTEGPSRETIRRMEKDMIPEDLADSMIVWALAEVYEVDLGYLSPVVDRKLAKIGQSKVKVKVKAVEQKKRRPRRPPHGDSESPCYAATAVA